MSFGWDEERNTDPVRSMFVSARKWPGHKDRLSDGYICRLSDLVGGDIVCVETPIGFAWIEIAWSRGGVTVRRIDRSGRCSTRSGNLFSLNPGLRCRPLALRPK